MEWLEYLYFASERERECWLKEMTFLTMDDQHYFKLHLIQIHVQSSIVDTI